MLGDPVGFVDVDGLMTKRGYDLGASELRKKSFCIYYKKMGVSGCDLALHQIYSTCGGNLACRADAYDLFNKCNMGKLDCEEEKEETCEDE